MAMISNDNFFRRTGIFLLCFPVFCLLLISCKNDKNKPDVSHIQLEVQVERFEQDFFSIDTSQMQAGIQQVFQKHPDFAPFFFRQLLGIGNLQGDTAKFILSQILSGYQPVYETARKKYPDMKWLQKELNEPFRLVKHYYPRYNLPVLKTFIGTFDAPGMVYTPRHLAIGLQQYLGPHFPAYQDPQVMEMFPTYITRRFDKPFMPVNVIKAIADDIYPDTTDNAKLIELMIEKGKQWWLLDKFLPDTPDSLKTGYTRKQMEWCLENEGNIWGSILQNTPDIYTLDQERLQNYIGESPRTMDMPEESPGNIGQWVGWQIVRKFEEKNPELTVQQVLATPAFTIFQEAKYRPK